MPDQLGDDIVFVYRLPRASEFHRTGDLVFCRDNGVISKILRAGQRYLDGELAAYSHVAICVYPGLLMHSVPGGGVQFLPVEQRHPEQIGFDPTAVADRSTLVLRPAYAELPSLTALRAMLYWTGQKYNFSFRRPIATTSGRAYCSQLIVQILRKLDFVDEAQFPELKVTPSALFRFVSGAGADDVSERYSAYDAVLRSEKAERYRLARDIPRIQIINAAVHTVRQAQATRAVDDLAALLTAKNAIEGRNVADQIRLLNARARSFDVTLSEAVEHLQGASLVFQLLAGSSITVRLHYMDERAAPLAAMSGMVMHGGHFEIIFEEMSNLMNKLTQLDYALDESLSGPTGVVEATLYNNAYETLSAIFIAPHAAYRAIEAEVGQLIDQATPHHPSIIEFIARMDAMRRSYREVTEYYNVIMPKLKNLVAVDLDDAGREIGVAAVE